MRPYETAEMNNERRKVFFVVYKISGSIDQGIMFANISVNMKYLKCKYPEQLTNQLEQYLEHRWRRFDI